MEPSEILVMTSIISRTIGPIFGIFILLVTLSFCFLWFFWKKRMENLADEISSKTIKLFDTRLSLSLSDTEIRKELLLYTGKKSIETQLLLYDDIWNLYHKYQETWILARAKNNTELNKILNLIHQYRNKIFRQSLFLSAEYYLYLSEASSMMWKCTYQKLERIINQDISEINIMRDEILIIENINKAMDYLRNSLRSYQNIDQYDFVEQEKEILKRDREELFSKPEL